MGEGSLAGGERHQFHQFQPADVEVALILKTTGFKRTPQEMAVFQLGAAAAIQLHQLSTRRPAAEQRLTSTLQPSESCEQHESQEKR